MDSAIITICLTLAAITLTVTIVFSIINVSLTSITNISITIIIAAGIISYVVVTAAKLILCSLFLPMHCQEKIAVGAGRGPLAGAIYQKEKMGRGSATCEREEQSLLLFGGWKCEWK